MPRKRTKAEDIRDAERYWNRYMALERKSERLMTKRYYEMFRSLDELLEPGEEGISVKLRLSISTNLDGREYERYIADKELFGWIEGIENDRLREAAVMLGDEDKTLLSLRFDQGMSQRETAEMMGISQVAVHKREERLKKYFQKVLR